jgi:hypothetical protein
VIWHGNPRLLFNEAGGGDGPYEGGSRNISWI